MELLLPNKVAEHVPDSAGCRIRAFKQEGPMMLDADRINLSIHAQELRSISARLYRNDLMLECKNEFACPHVSVSAQSRSFREPARFGEQDGRTPKSVPMAHAGRILTLKHLHILWCSSKVHRSASFANRMVVAKSSKVGPQAQPRQLRV